MEMGGAEELVKMLCTAKDDRTRKEALRALSALSDSGKINVFTVAFCNSFIVIKKIKRYEELRFRGVFSAR